MERIAIIGYGEAARAFVAGGLGACSAYDSDPAKRHGIATTASAAEALEAATLVLSLVTADQVLAAASECAAFLAPGALWCDMNSVAPDTKRAAARVIAAAGARYLDVAVMAPVEPARLGVPLLVSGPGDGAGRLRAAGFANVRGAGEEIGRASAIKMIRSVMVKGVEALTAEMMAAGEAAGVSGEVLGSLGEGWAEKAAYNLERMATHGGRRAAEMEEVAKTLESLGIDPVMTRGTIIRQRQEAQAALKEAA